MIKQANLENDLRIEALRKLVNLASFILPVVYYFSTRALVLQILVPLTIAFLIVDLARFYHGPTAEVFYKIFGVILRKHERDHEAKRLNGATWFLLAATICVYIFPKYIAVTSFAIFSFADIASALIGRRFGRRKFNNRSLEGTLAFIATAALVIALTPKIEYSPAEYLLCFSAAVVGAVAEVLSYNIVDDNIAIPISTGLSMWLLFLFFQPLVHLHNYGF